ncbi:hypothetical protein R5W23_003006 [Gemmata sp. JC673]|uniref:Glycosyltransferase n=1 Tax=Gemmata algarum TaxID=2975278 RepID=A0ABU5EVJ4_9BACT|nr:hypothetical protein [Gemmata algarum]MDY3557741.1 hypothetical protein [Gemmata algarum]
MKPTHPVVLVPVGTSIDPACDDALRGLEQRGYTVRRVRGHSAADSARNQMATDALADGFDELIWIDPDVVFRPDDVDALRANGWPLACALYPKPGLREFACTFLPRTPTERGRTCAAWSMSTRSASAGSGSFERTTWGCSKPWRERCAEREHTPGRFPHPATAAGPLV